MRLPETPPRVMRAVAVAAVVGQGGIAVTGAVVRVTGSGLGCPTWPTCFPGSLVPRYDPDVAALNQWVEFGNRLLTVLLVIVAGACLLAALGLRPRRRRVTRLAAAMPLGVVAQAVLGGITVLTGLAWYTVALHLLVSMVLVWLAVLLVRGTHPDALAAPPGAPWRGTVPPAARGLLVVLTGVLAAVLVVGTLVTSAGPHAGDATTPRLDASVATLATLHAHLLFAFLGLLVGFGFLAHAVGAARVVRRRFGTLVAVTLAQGTLGGAQYALGVPEALVALHVLGAVLVTVAAAALWAATTEPVTTPAGVPDPATPVLAGRT